MLKMKAYLMASAGLALLGVVEPANAQLHVMGAGATFPSIAYRQVMDCIFVPLGDGIDGPGPLGVSPLCPGYPYGQAVFNYVRMYYAPTGSGNGKTAFKANSNASVTTPSGTSTVPYTSSLVPHFPWGTYYGYQFSGSDDVWTAADAASWTAGPAPSKQTKFGNVIQLPTIAGPVTIPFNGNDGNGNPLNINNANPSTPGGTSKLNLSRKAMCGIFSGHITKWNNPILTALNGGVDLGTGNITVVHRSDGSGTTFLFTNGLAEQCRFEFGPTNETVGTLVSYAFPWTERTSSCDPTVLYVPKGANTVNWPDYNTVATGDQCSVAIPNSGGGTFVRGDSSGNSAVIAKINAVPGAIGYSSADFVQPVVPALSGGLATANLQSQFDLDAATGTFVAPTVAATTLALSSVVPNFNNDPALRGNALAWSSQGVIPNPSVPGAYPIAGFTWMFMYQCYQNNGIPYDVLLTNFLAGLYGSLDIENMLNANGFIKVPYPWLYEIYQLLNDDNLRPVLTGGVGPCNSKVGAL
jgi:ABC-type phosphate transport system substrate-binding protein